MREKQIVGFLVLLCFSGVLVWYAFDQKKDVIIPENFKRPSKELVIPLNKLSLDSTKNLATEAIESVLGQQKEEIEKAENKTPEAKQALQKTIEKQAKEGQEKILSNFLQDAQKIEAIKRQTINDIIRARFLFLKEPAEETKMEEAPETPSEK